MEYLENCPSCGEEWDGYECQNCGLADIENVGEYDTPNGMIAYCSEEDAFAMGYVSICTVCCYNVIKWWETEDHGMCIECWHKRNENSLTNDEKGGIIS